MKQSMKVSRRQLALWFERGDQVQPSEEIREELTRALADLLLEAMQEPGTRRRPLREVQMNPKIAPDHLEPRGRRLYPPVDPGAGGRQPREPEAAIRPGRGRQGGRLCLHQSSSTMISAVQDPD